MKQKVIELNPQKGTCKSVRLTKDRPMGAWPLFFLDIVGVISLRRKSESTLASSLKVLDLCRLVKTWSICASLLIFWPGIVLVTAVSEEDVFMANVGTEENNCIWEGSMIITSLSCGNYICNLKIKKAFNNIQNILYLCNSVSLLIHLPYYYLTA